MTNQRFFAASLLICLMLLSSCNNKDYQGADRFPLSGKVTVNGEPIDFGTISFLPTRGDEQRVSGGEIISGVYDVKEARGANSGMYRVEIRWSKPTGKKIKDRDTGDLIDERAEGLPAKFHSKSALTVEVSRENHFFDFDLEL